MNFSNFLEKWVEWLNKEFDLNDPYYLNGKEYVYKTIETLANKKYMPVLFYSEFYPTFKDRDEFKKCVDYYMAIMIKMIEDALEAKQIDDEDYNNHLELLRKYDCAKLLEIFMEANDKLLINAERKLLFDSIACQIISYI